MITDKRKILIEWAYRTRDGKPNPKSMAHQIILEGVLKDFGWGVEERNELLKNLQEDSPGVWVGMTKDGNKRYFKDKESLQRALKRGSVTPADKKDDDEVDRDAGKPKDTDFFDRGLDKEKEDEPRGDKEEPEEKGVVAGAPNEGDNQVKNDMFKYGYKGYEKATGSKPAPGGAGSAFNEIMSGEGVHILEENSDMTEEELARQLYERSKDTKLGEEQKSTVGIGKKDTPDDIENSDLWSKCLVSARSAKKKFERTQTRVKRLQEDGKFGEPQKTSTFYGAQSSIDAQVRMVENANKVLLPNGQEVKKEDAIAFIQAGGGGMNPSDTATFVEDDNGNLLIQFHSDKTTTNDIQDNSTLIQEGENYKDYIEQSNLSNQNKEEANNIVDDYSNQISEIEENYNDQATPIARRLTELPIEDQIQVIEDDAGTIRENIDVAIFGKGGKLKKQFEDYLPAGKNPEDLTLQEKYEMIRKLVSDGKGKGNETKVVNKVGLGLQKKDSSIEGIDVKKNLSEQREKVVSLQRERINKLDELEQGLGTKMEANEASRAFHLSMMDYPPKNYEEGNISSIMGTALDVNMGGNIVDGEVLRECLGVENTKEFKGEFELEESDELQYDKQGNVTGKRVFTYVVDKEGRRTKIGYKTYRSKSGAAGKTNNTMSYSLEMQKCFKSKN